MPASVTGNAECDQIFQRIMAEFTSEIKMMDFQHFCGTAILASPSIPIQNLNLKRLIAHGVQFQSRFFLAYSSHPVSQHQ